MFLFMHVMGGVAVGFFWFSSDRSETAALTLGGGALQLRGVVLRRLKIGTRH